MGWERGVREERRVGRAAVPRGEASLRGLRWGRACEQQAMHAFAISSTVNGSVVGMVTGLCYLAGIEKASDLRQALRGLNASIRDSAKPQQTMKSKS